MKTLPASIKIFLLEQSCASVCCISENGSTYCFSCYYALNPDQGLLYFKSTGDSRHSVYLTGTSSVAGTILPDKLNLLFAVGIQFQGEVLLPNHPSSKEGSVLYHKKFPIALAVAGEVWTIRLTDIKMTDSRTIFGKKKAWSRGE